MAEITNVTYLMRKENGGSTFTKVCDITSYPDLIGAPETIEVTTLSNKKKKSYINGLQEGEIMEFGWYYDKATYTTIAGYETADAATTAATLSTYQLWFGENGANGIFEWQGRLRVGIPGGEPNNARQARLYISDEGAQELHYVTE